MSNTRLPSFISSLAAMCRLLAYWASSRAGSASRNRHSCIAGRRRGKANKMSLQVRRNVARPSFEIRAWPASCDSRAHRCRANVCAASNAAPCRRHLEFDDVRNGAFLDHKCAVHIGFAEPELWIKQYAECGRKGHKGHPDGLAGALAEGQRCTIRNRHPKCSGFNKRVQNSLQRRTHRKPPFSQNCLSQRRAGEKIGR